jgi:HEAT repeat protein
MMRHIATHLATVDYAVFERVKTMCLALGEVLIRPLADVLSKEERGQSRERLTAIMIGFGPTGKREVERLKSSPNAAVRRTAIYLLREFGGADALPELTELLDDSEPQVQREAVRAILNVGTDRAYQVLEKALTDGTPQSREAIMQSLSGIRDERATPLFVYIVSHVDHRGQLGWVYHRAIETLGALKDPAAIPVLKEALYRGEWWAPRRTAQLRTAAAAALARIGTAEATELLREAAHHGPRGVRNAARAHLTLAHGARRAAR